MLSKILFYTTLAYLAGSLPFALWITRWVKGIDVRDGGSGHVTTTNTIRQAGWLPGVLVLVLDISKGFLPAYLARHAGLPEWAVGLVAAFVVVGHCWPLFAQFRGGMGLAAAGGSILSASPLAFAVGLGVLVLLVLLMRHAARASVVAALIQPAVFWLIGLRDAAWWVSVGVGVILAIRFYQEDWHRKYRELWLDREQSGQ
jgi:glycerol-3-phosphate acyltransferase PlsY